tara:strand:+ start:123 stop:623 length:501 start_codon:yes stop_codon:yes gene_type:complete
MASFNTKTFTKHDNYMTPKHAWEAVQQFIPKDKVIWEAFAGNGYSSKYLTELGFNVVCKEEDFFDSDYGDIIITNPPFSLKKEVLMKLKELGKPFMIICPSAMIMTQYTRKLFSKEKLQIIIPRRRIHFIKTDDDGNILPTDNKCNFDCFYYCWKMNLEQDILWLE